MFAFTEDITIQSGGQKAKDLAQTMDRGFSGGRKSMRWDSLVVIPSGTLRRRTFAIAEFRRMIRTLRYNDVELPYPDCKGTEKLCMGGPCYFLITLLFAARQFCQHYTNKSGPEYLQTTPGLDFNCSW